MKDAIARAIEGGYDRKNLSTNVMDDILNAHEILLDPLFWSSLGKALGWDVHCISVWGGKKCEERKRCSVCGKGYRGYPHPLQKQWPMYWHRFIDHLAEGKSIELFFEELLSVGSGV